MTSQDETTKDETAKKIAVKFAYSLIVFIPLSYDWGFLFSLGISLAKAPTTIYDHIQSWPTMVMTPSVAFTIIFSSVVMLVTFYFIKDKKDEEIVRVPFKILMKINCVVLFLFFLCFLFILFCIEDPNLVIIYAIMCIPFAWIMLTIFVLNNENARDKISVFPRIFIHITIPMYVVAFIHGFYHVKYGDKKSHTTTVEYVENKTVSLISKEIEILRIFSEWLLVRQNEKVSWIRLADINRIDITQMKSKENKENLDALICRLLGGSCRRGAPPRLDSDPHYP